MPDWVNITFLLKRKVRRLEVDAIKASDERNWRGLT